MKNKVKNLVDKLLAEDRTVEEIVKAVEKKFGRQDLYVWFCIGEYIAEKKDGSNLERGETRCRLKSTTKQ